MQHPTSSTRTPMLHSLWYVVFGGREKGQNGSDNYISIYFILFRHRRSHWCVTRAIRWPWRRHVNARCICRRRNDRTAAERGCPSSRPGKCHIPFRSLIYYLRRTWRDSILYWVWNLFLCHPVLEIPPLEMFFVTLSSIVLFLRNGKNKEANQFVRLVFQGRDD